MMRVMSHRNRRRLERFDQRCARSLARQRARAELYRAAEPGGSPSPYRSLPFALGALACLVGAWVIWVRLDHSVVALVLGLAFWILLGVVIAQHIDRRDKISGQALARALTAREEAKVRELEASQARRRHALAVALGLEDS